MIDRLVELKIRLAINRAIAKVVNYTVIKFKNTFEYYSVMHDSITIRMIYVAVIITLS